MRDTRTFRIWSGVFFLVSILTNLFRASFLGLSFMKGYGLLNAFFLNLIPGIASLILAEPKKKNSIMLTAVLGTCLAENLTAVLIGVIHNLSLLTSVPVRTGYAVTMSLLNISLPLLVCLIMAIRALKDSEESLRENPAREPNREKKAAGIVLIITGALLIPAAAAGTIIILLSSTLGSSDPQFSYIYLMAVFAIVLLLSGTISIRAASGKAAYYAPEIYSFFIIVIFFAKGMLQLLLPWFEYGGGFMQGSGDVVIVRAILSFLLFCAFLWFVGRLVSLIASFVRERRAQKNAE